MFIVGHRGARAVAPENTLRAVRIGMACADYVEVDVRLSGDGVPVIMHDAALERTTDGRGAVREYSLSELKEFDAGDGEKVPALQEVVDLLAGRCGLFVEMKEEGSVGAVCRILNAFDPTKLFLVSFHENYIKNMNDLMPGVRTGFIFSREERDPISVALSVGADAIIPRKDLLTVSLTERAHRCGLLVIPWVLNTEDDVLAAQHAGVDGFVSDDPCRMREFLKMAGKQ